MDADIATLIAQGNKIEAIKRYRERTGVGLKEAKDAVDAWERGEPVEPPPVATVVEGDAQETVDRLIREGKKIEAIRVHRERTGLGLKESKEAVEARERELGVSGGRTGCFIATAAYGSPFAPEVDALRRFRDRRLRRSPLGRRAVRLYYRLSPPVARLLERSRPLRGLVRLLLRPFLAYARRREP